MKKNKKSVSVKNTKSFLGNPPALVNTTFFVPAANLNSNDGIFTDLHDNPSNFSSSNPDPNWSFDISNKLFAQSGKKKIFADDKFKNMISYNQDTYTGDLFSDDFAPTRYPYDSIEREVSPVLSEVDFPTYKTVEPQPVSVGVAPVDGDYFAPSMVYRDTFMDADVIKSGIGSNSDFFVDRGVTRMSDLLNQSDVVMQPEPVSVGVAPVDGDYFASANVSPITRYKEGDIVAREVGDLAPVRDEVFAQREILRPNYATEGVTLVSKPATEVMEVKDLTLQNAPSVPSDSIQPTTVEEDKKAKKPYNWLPLLLVAAAVGGYMYYNRKK